MRFDLASEWPLIVETFHTMFEGLGTIVSEPDRVDFRSNPPHVATGVTLTISGLLHAHMPLHAVETAYTTVVFEEGLERLRLEGPALSYTYTVPPELLALRQ